jgi:hypothetical protein
MPTACSSRPAATTLHDLAEQYVRVTLQLAQHRPNLVDAWTGPVSWQPGPRRPVTELQVAVEQLRAKAEALRPQAYDRTEASRIAYLQGQVRALTLITRRLLGESGSFAEEVTLAFGRPLPQPSADAMAKAREAVSRELPGDAPLEERYRRFRRGFMVDSSRTEAVVRAAVEACRTATASYLVLPADEQVALAVDEAIEWDAYAQYLGGHRTLLKIGSPSGHDVAALLRMACHETYAGHHAQHILIDDALVKGRGWMEFHLTPAFGPHRLISEGAAETGVDLALPEETRAAIYRDHLLPLAGLPPGDASRLAKVETLAATLDAAVAVPVARYLDNQASSADTIRTLATAALLPAPEQFLSFAERHRTNAVVYPIGKAVVSEQVARGTTVDERWRRLQDLFTRTPFTLD